MPRSFRVDLMRSCQIANQAYVCQQELPSMSASRLSQAECQEAPREQGCSQDLYPCGSVSAHPALLLAQLLSLALFSPSPHRPAQEQSSGVPLRDSLCL